MNNKYIIFLTLLFFLIISISSVHASNDTTGTVYSTDNNSSYSIYENKLDELSKEDIKQDNSKKIHKTIVNNSKQLSTTLSNISDEDSHYIYYTNSTFTDDIVIGDRNSKYNPKISIYGSLLDDVDVDSNATITIYSGCVTFKHISFIKCINTDYTITNYGNLTIADSNILYNDNFIKNYGNLMLNNCEIRANVATDSLISNIQGSILLNESYVYDNQGQFADNFANLTVYGTNIHGHNKSSIKLDPSQSYSFIENHNNATLNISYTAFRGFYNNSCTIIVNHGNLTVYNVGFYYSTVRNAIVNYALANITNSDFEFNIVDSLIINEFDKDHLIKEYMYIKSNKFDANIGHNGVILFNRAKAIFNNNNCWNNTAYYNGCLSNGGKLITHANNFRNNHVVKCGLIYNWNLLDSSKDYYNNNTARYGGCIYNTGNASIANTLMKFSQAVNASTIYNTGNMNITKSNINKNKAKNGGTIFNNGSLNMSFNSVYNNKASCGGVILNYYRLSLFSNAFKYNIADNASAVANIPSEHIIHAPNPEIDKHAGYFKDTLQSFAICISLRNVYTLNKALTEATILNQGHMIIAYDTIKTLGVNTYLIVNTGTINLKNSTLVNYNHMDESLIKNNGTIYNATC